MRGFGQCLRAWALSLALFGTAGQAWAGPESLGPFASAAGAFRVEVVASGLETPWGLAFLPHGRMLVTERPGRLRVVAPDGRLSPPVQGVPAVYARGQGGLLDVALSPDFARKRTLFLSFAQPMPGGSRTAVVRARLNAAGDGLEEVRQIFAQKEVVGGGGHFGSRLIFDRQGNLFVTLGERYTERARAQDLGSDLGKVVRIRPDGSIPPDNPFVNRAGVLPEIWSYGHRNVQGAVLRPGTDQLWTGEHGPQGGDEINLDLPGRNYGWPVITYGREYGSGAKIGEGTVRADVEAPRLQWTPSIAPSGMDFYTGKRFPAWQGNLFVGALKFHLLARLELAGDRIVKEERLLEELGLRIRNVRQGPDGLIYLLDESKGRILRLVPD